MIDRFLDWFERHKFGVVGTLMLHTLLMFSFAMGKLDSVQGAPPEDLLELELATPQELPDQDLVQSPEMEALEVKNLNSNSSAEAASAPSPMGRAAQERMAQGVEEDLRAFERAEFDRLAAERTARGEDVVIPEIDSSKWRKELYMRPERKPVKVEGATTVSYDLPGRVDEVLDVPAYLCKGRGRVVIQVAVDKAGRVQKADLDTGASTTDACMQEHALASASKARFSSAPEAQRGTITYTYVAQ